MISLVSGQQLGDNHLVQLLGRGGMGDVWLAERRGPEGFIKRLIVKVIHPNLVHNAEASALFSREARIAALLHHPYLVQTYAFDRSDDGVPFLTMEYVPGRNLFELIRFVSPVQDRRSVAAWCRLLSMAADGVAYLHKLADDDGKVLGLVHRDIKPANIMVAVDGRPRVLDFGVARLADDGPGTLPGTFRGTPQYASPEQCTGLPATPSCDVFALGIVLYHVLSGVHPFAAPDAIGFMYAILQVDPPLLHTVCPAVPPSISAVVRRALAKDPAGRFADAGELRDALIAALDTDGLLVTTAAAQAFGRSVVRDYDEAAAATGGAAAGASGPDVSSQVAQPVSARAAAGQPAELPRTRASSSRRRPSEPLHMAGAAAVAATTDAAKIHERARSDHHHADTRPRDNAVAASRRRTRTTVTIAIVAIAALVAVAWYVRRAATPPARQSAASERDATTSQPASTHRRAPKSAAVVPAAVVPAAVVPPVVVPAAPKSAAVAPAARDLSSAVRRDVAESHGHDATAHPTTQVKGGKVPQTAPHQPRSPPRRHREPPRHGDRRALRAKRPIDKPSALGTRKAAKQPEKTIKKSVSSVDPTAPMPPSTVNPSPKTDEKRPPATRKPAARKPAARKPAARKPATTLRVTTLRATTLPTTVMAYSIRELKSVLRVVERHLIQNLAAPQLRGALSPLANALTTEFNPGTPFRVPAAAIYRAAGRAYLAHKSIGAIQRLLVHRYSGHDL